VPLVDPLAYLIGKVVLLHATGIQGMTVRIPTTIRRCSFLCVNIRPGGS